MAWFQAGDLNIDRGGPFLVETREEFPHRRCYVESGSLFGGAVQFPTGMHQFSVNPSHDIVYAKCMTATGTNAVEPCRPESGAGSFAAVERRGSGFVASGFQSAIKFFLKFRHKHFPSALISGEGPVQPQVRNIS